MTQPANPPGKGSPSSADAEGMPKRFGKYTLLRKLATGGMAELFLALQRSVAGFEKLVVIKRILPSMTRDQAFIDMLLHEARIAATLSHPNVTQIFDVGFVDDAYYIAMEYVQGEDLRSIVRQMRARGMNEFPLEHALTVVLGTCAGLAYAHEKRDIDGTQLNIVHRDISPQNVLITYTGDIKVVDFGIAKSGYRPVGEDTLSGRLKGKVPYMSPEQARGEEVDWRTDIFATGIMLFELTTGKRLFKGANEVETLRLIVDREYPRPTLIRPAYPKRLETIVMRALEKDKTFRYQSARELQADLESYIRDERVAASEIALGRWMNVLFAERIAAQKMALQDVKQLADIIAAQAHHSGSFDVPDISSQSGQTSSGSVPGAVASIAGGGQRRSRTPLVIGIGAAIAALAVGGFFVMSRPSSAPAPASAAASSDTAPRLGSLRIESDPPEASIVINGDLRAEKTPATIDKLPIGSALQVKVTKEGFAPERQEITLTADKPSTTVRAVLSKGTGKVTVTANVPNVYLALDGKPVTGPTVEAVTPNEEHRITVAAQGYKASSQAFIVGPNETKTLSVTLERDKAGGEKNPYDEVPDKPPVAVGTGKLNVGSRGGYCAVSVDGRAHGSTPVGGIQLPAGNHRVTCRTEAGKTLSQGVRIEADQTARVSFTIE